jgi:SPP1 gp7 family putative phage head morphogenesis protein
MPLEVSTDPVYPEAAIRFFRNKIGVTEDEWDALEEQNHDLSFKLAGIADIDVVDDVYSAIDDAITNGTTLEEFKTKVWGELENAWGGEVVNPGWRIETIFRTNLQSSYQAGHYQQAQENKEDRPYAMLDVVEDGRTSDICADLDEEIGGRAIPLDDPIWSRAWPPNHFNCRSSVITMDEQEAIAEGFLEDSPDPPSADELDIDEDFDHAPGDSLDEGLPDPEEYPEDLQEDVERFL